MSRNEQRTTAAMSPAASTNPVDAGPATEQAPVARSASLSYVTPTEFVELPSGGQYYHNEHPLRDKEVVEMRYMTARDEDILTSPALLRKGLAVDRLLENLIVDQNIDVNELLVGDRNAMLISARVSGYGQDYAVELQCPACGETVRNEFDLSKLEINHGLKPGEDSQVSLTERGTFLAELPVTKYLVEFRLLTGRDETELQNLADKLKKHKLPDATSTNLLKKLVVSVNDVTSGAEISSFIDNMPAQDARFLRACMQVVTPNIDMSQQTECSSCGAVTETEVPFTSEFFWPQ